MATPRPNIFCTHALGQQNFELEKFLSDRKLTLDSPLPDLYDLVFTKECADKIRTQNHITQKLDYSITQHLSALQKIQSPRISKEVNQQFESLKPSQNTANSTILAGNLLPKSPSQQTHDSTNENVKEQKSQTMFSKLFSFFIKSSEAPTPNPEDTRLSPEESTATKITEIVE